MYKCSLNFFVVIKKTNGNCVLFLGPIILLGSNQFPSFCENDE